MPCAATAFDANGARFGRAAVADEGAARMTELVAAMQAIRAATYWPAVAMKVDQDYGTLTPGKWADVIAVRGDVLRYPALLQNVPFVMQHGKVVKDERVAASR